MLAKEPESILIFLARYGGWVLSALICLTIGWSLIRHAKAEPRATTQTFSLRIATLPPARFDHPYEGSVVIQTLQPANAYSVCAHNGAPADGCSWVTKSRACVVVLPNNLSALERERFVRHELGHCNGWGANHEP